jgi:hypothetical protein
VHALQECRYYYCIRRTPVWRHLIDPKRIIIPDNDGNAQTRGSKVLLKGSEVGVYARVLRKNEKK